MTLAPRYALASSLALLAAATYSCLPASSDVDGSGIDSPDNGAAGSSTTAVSAAGSTSTSTNPLRPIANNATGQAGSNGETSTGGQQGNVGDADAGPPKDMDMPDVVSVCGNGVVEGSEACDGSPCCNATCDGAGPSGTICRESKGLCDEAESCDGISFECPEDGFVVAGAECRASTQGCDPAETCTGDSAQCPEDATTCDSCVEDAVNTLGAPVITDSITNDDEDFVAPCSTESGGPDRVIAFEAPQTGEYHFDTFGSQFDTVLALFDSCEATQVAEDQCSQDTTINNELSLVDRSMQQGELVFVHVSGNRGETGTFELNITQKLSCASSNLGVAVVSSLEGSTEDAEDRVVKSCGSPGDVDDVFEFRIPETGSYQFDVVGLPPAGDENGNRFDPTLSLLSGCEGPQDEIACLDDIDAASLNFDTRLTYEGIAGEQLLIAIGGYENVLGRYELSISRID